MHEQAVVGDVFGRYHFAHLFVLLVAVAFPLAQVAHQQVVEFLHHVLAVVGEVEGQGVPSAVEEVVPGLSFPQCSYQRMLPFFLLILLFIANENHETGATNAHAVGLGKGSSHHHPLFPDRVVQAYALVCDL